jgi:hypothetical protein
VESHVADALPTHPGAPGAQGKQTPATQNGVVPLQAASAGTHWPPEHVSGVEARQAVAPLVHAGALASPSGPSAGASAAPSSPGPSLPPESAEAASLAPSFVGEASLVEASCVTPPESLAEESLDVASSPPPSPEDDEPAELPHAVRRTASGNHRIRVMATLLPER